MPVVDIPESTGGPFFQQSPTFVLDKRDNLHACAWEAGESSAVLFQASIWRQAKVSLHGFSDASTVAFAAVVCLRVEADVELRQMKCQYDLL